MLTSAKFCDFFAEIAFIMFSEHALIHNISVTVCYIRLHYFVQNNNIWQQQMRTNTNRMARH